jgi:hypothetical protein
MPRRNPYGRITPQRARELAANLPPSSAPVLKLLTDDPAGRVAAAAPRPVDEDELPEEFARLFGPVGGRVQASAPLTDDECYALLFGDQP